MTGLGVRLAAGGIALALVALTSPAHAGSRQPVPHGSGGGHPSAAPHGTATRGGVPPHGTASGTAHYGYGGYYGGGGYWGNPWWGWYGGYPYWGIGWSVSWGWPYYYGYYGPYYGPTYVYPGAPPAPSGPSVIETDVTPKKAEVVLDGQIIGHAKDFNGRWDELRIDPGRHTIAFRYDGYRTLVFEIEAQAGARYVLDEAMAAGSGEDRRVIAPPPKRVAEESAGPIEHPATEDPRGVPAGVPKGLLRVRVLPEDAGVYLDGEFLGMGSELARLHGAIPVATGEHRLEVVRPGYAGDVRTVYVDAKGTSEVEVTLTKAR